MSISSLTLLLLLLAIHESIQKSTPESLTYRAVVVEMRSVQFYNDTEKTMHDNAKRMVEYIDLAAKKDADILVLPELCLTGLYLGSREQVFPLATLIPEPSQNYVPCTNSTIPVVQGIREVSCAADRNDIYVVINTLEKEICSPTATNCPSDGVFFYVTNVVFDREGKIISRYRKSHLPHDNEGVANVKKPTEVSTFDTDFGVTFGNLICFDIVFEEPLFTLTRKLNVTDIIFTSGWVNISPFLNSVQMQSGWAYAEDVNMLASGYTIVELGFSGSGIYAGRQGVMTSVLLMDHQEAVLVADVPKKSKKTVTTPKPQYLNQKHDLILETQITDHQVFDTMRQEGDLRSFRWLYHKLDAFESEVIVENGCIKRRLRHSGIDCEFQLDVTNLSPPVTYRLLVFDGLCSTGECAALGTKTCAIVHCSNETLDSCGHVQKSSATFNFIEIKASYIDNPRITVIPSTLGSDMLTLKNWTFDQHKQDEYVHTSISLTAPTQNLITFGLFARDYEKDDPSINFF